MNWQRFFQGREQRADRRGSSHRDNEEIEIEIAEKVEEDNDGATGMIIREWAERYGTNTKR